MSDLILSWDGCLEDDGWRGSIAEHNPANRYETRERWSKRGVRTEHNLTVSMEAAHTRIMKAGISKFGDSHE